VRSIDLLIYRGRQKLLKKEAANKKKKGIEMSIVEIIQFVSRHNPTPAQEATMETEGYGAIRLVPDVIFDIAAPARPQLEGAGVNTEQPFGMVAPGWFLRRALLEGCPTIYEFINAPSARSRGVFVCNGVVKHTAGAVEFIPCPVPIEEQEEQTLAPPSR
jgi:hypothetical protein